MASCIVCYIFKIISYVTIKWFWLIIIIELKLFRVYQGFLIDPGFIYVWTHMLKLEFQYMRYSAKYSYAYPHPQKSYYSLLRVHQWIEACLTTLIVCCCVIEWDQLNLFTANFIFEGVTVKTDFRIKYLWKQNTHLRVFHRFLTFSLTSKTQSPCV